MSGAPRAETPNRRKPKKRRSERQSDTERPGLATRQCAQRLLSAIVDKSTPMDAVTDDKHGHPTYLSLEPRDRSLVRAILMAALRYRGDLEAVIDGLVERPLPEGALSLRAILHVAGAQIFFLDVPTHSAVDLAVESANRDPRNRRFASLVNAVTRRMVREKSKHFEAFSSQPKNTPDWFFDRLGQVYTLETAIRIFELHRHPAPIDITLKEPSDAVANGLLEGRQGQRTSSTNVRLTGKMDVTQLPGFDDGHWWVQDYAASIPAKLFGNFAGKRILDLCAAPGGKTAQLLAMGAQVTALEKSASRARRLEDNLARLQLAGGCSVFVTDLFDFEVEEPFDGVLLDAPCSSTGTVRRHPDVPWTKSPADIQKLADLQSRMLAKAAEFVAPGGVLVFSNCSLDPLEGEQVAKAFTFKTSDFAAWPVVAADFGLEPDMIDEDGHVRTTPAHLPNTDISQAGMDGFFAARFRRR
ncbi:MAG: RsmB/NOP family class I SAM-dependent RNA methyltransferase [Pseudomonadota bacterium]